MNDVDSSELIWYTKKLPANVYLYYYVIYVNLCVQKLCIQSIYISCNMYICVSYMAIYGGTHMYIEIRFRNASGVVYKLDFNL